MSPNNGNRHILAITKDAKLIEIVRQVVDENISVNQAADKDEGFTRIRDIRPDLIILGPLDIRGEAFSLYRALKKDWIAHHASLLIVEQRIAEGTYRILSDENVVTGIGEFRFPDGSTGTFLPREVFDSRLGEIIAQKLKSRENRLRRSMLNPGEFCLIWEQIPGPGAFEVRQEKVLENARKAAKIGRIAAISITDNPGGNPAIATDILCAEIRQAGIDPLVHIAFRDRSRNQAESLLFQLAALEINNVLILTGDYPSTLGFTGTSKPVFDLDSVNGLRLVSEMNTGLKREILRKPVRLAATDFFAGVAFSPFKQMEAEVMGQYYKMRQKIAAGADFVITQVGYDARKLQEFLLWMQLRKYSLPALASVYVLSYPVAKAMHENHIPGCVVTGKLLDKLAEESQNSDKGRQARLDRAAKMLAVVKGLGYRGAYISGQGLPFESVEYIIDKGNELAGNWKDLLEEFDYPQEKGFYYFEHDAETGLNTPELSRKDQNPIRPLIYLVSKIFHAVIFEPQSPFFKPIQRFMQFVDNSNILYRLLHFLERCSKATLYGCKDCGDCALFDAAYLCPVSQCPKDQRNAPCGGSFQGWCEVYPGEKQCIWVQAYLRLKGEGKEDEIAETIVPPCNWSLWQTSSWVNYFLGRDHSSRRRSISHIESGKDASGQ